MPCRTGAATALELISHNETAIRFRVSALRVSLMTVVILAPWSFGCHSGANGALALSQVRGGVFHLQFQPQQPLLLAFLQTVPDTANTPSRGQAILLQSMDHQYASRGVRVVVVDASQLATGRVPQHGELVNASYDWGMTIPLLEDPDHLAARRFGIKTVPTTILFKPDGSVQHRWEGPVHPAEFAQEIERLVGGPLGRVRDL